MSRAGRTVRGLMAGAGLLAAAAAAAQPLAYELDAERSWVHFELLHFGTATLRGRFGPVSGQVTLDRAAGGGRVQVVIDTAAVDSGLRVFDAVLRRSELLDTAAHPQAFFIAERLRFDGDALAEVGGELTLRGVSRTVVLRAQRFGCRPDAAASAVVEICGGDFEGELSLSAFGITYGGPFVGDRVRLRVQVQARRGG